MAGVTLTLKGTEQLDRVLSQIASTVTNLRPLMEEIGEIGQESILENFEKHESPKGALWQALSKPYEKWKTKKKGRNASDILILKGASGGLLGSLHPFPTSSEIKWSTNKEYAAIHNFGGIQRHSPRSFTVALEDDSNLFMSRKKASRRKKKAVRVRFMRHGAYVVYMPKREFMGIKPDAMDRILRAAEDFLSGALR